MDYPLEKFYYYDQYRFRMSEEIIKYSKLTIIQEDGRCNGNRLYLCLCECGLTCKRTMQQLKNNRLHSCGCSKNYDKKKLLDIECIPEKYRQYITINSRSMSLGNNHHRQWGSDVICYKCGYKKWLRNERVLHNIQRSGCPYICQSCGGLRTIMRDKIEPGLVEKIKEEYMNGDQSWREIAEKYNLSHYQLSQQCDSKILTKYRRIQQRKLSLQRMEEELISQEKAFIEKEKAFLEKKRVELTDYEEKVKQILGKD